MAIKKLQNNFTTPEQSKRLLELGVPAYSADCYLLKNRLTKRYEYIQVINNQDDLNFLNEDSTPCWSVGRLIEICNICNITDFPIEFEVWRRTRVIEYMLELIEQLYTTKCIDFSKLEE